MTAPALPPPCRPPGIHREQLKPTVPFGIDIDLTEVTRP